jgi:hypothetical protein
LLPSPSEIRSPKGFAFFKFLLKTLTDVSGQFPSASRAGKREQDAKLPWPNLTLCGQLLIEITYELTPEAALIMLAGIYYGAQHAGRHGNDEMREGLLEAIRDEAVTSRSS